jgi:hypothetical protein
MIFVALELTNKTKPTKIRFHFILNFQKIIEIE